jgi:hypothetical protein
MVSTQRAETFLDPHRLIYSTRRHMRELEGVLGLMVPVTAIVMVFGLAGWSVYWKYQRQRLQYQERQLMIEKGIVPPPQLLDDDSKRITPEYSLRRGVVLLCLGFGLALAGIFLANLGDEEELVWIAEVAASIVGSLGVGNLVYYFITRPRSES